MRTIARISHVRELCDKRGWDRRTALREIQYQGNVSKPTSIKAYNGDTDLSLETVLNLAAMFGVSAAEIIETKVK